jgi:hypothetical protein
MNNIIVNYISVLMEESLKIIRDDLSYFIDEHTVLLYLFEFPVEWKTQDIYSNLNVVTPFKIKWLDDSSCFIKINKEKLGIAEGLKGDFKLIPLENEITIKRYFEWKKNHVPKKKEYPKIVKKVFERKIKEPIPVIQVTVVKNTSLGDTEKLIRTVNGTLNKLSESNFEKLSAKIMETVELDQTIIPGVVNVIYDKAIDQTSFISLYVRLCCKLCKFDDFKKLLLNKCKLEFDMDNRWLNDKNTERITLNQNELMLPEAEQLEVKRAKLKRNALGNVQLISNLYMYDFLSKVVIESCIRDLVKKCGDENIELLCKLIEIVRVKMDCDMYLRDLRLILGKCSPRIKTLLLNIIEK